MVSNLINYYSLPVANFAESCLINDVSAFRKVINRYISYILDTWSRDLNTNFTLGNCLFRAMKLTKNADPDKYGCSGYGTGFNARLQFSLLGSSWGNFIVIVIIFGVDNSSFVQVHNKKKNILVLRKGPTQGLDNTTITPEARYSIHFTESRERFVLSLHYNGSSGFLLVNTTIPLFFVSAYGLK